MTTSQPPSPTKSRLPYGILPHEIGFLIILGAAFYACDSKFWYDSWPVYVYSVAILAAVAVVILRCREEWLKVPNKWFFFTLTAIWVALFAVLGNSTFGYSDTPSLLKWMFGQYTSPSLDEGQGLLLPFVILVLYGLKRKELVSRPMGLWWPAIGLLAFGLLLHFVGFMAQQQRFSVLGFFIGLYGLTGLAWGWNWLKASFFPYFLLIFCVPVSEYSGQITLPLRLLVSRIVELIAHAGLAPDLIRQGNVLYDAQHTFAYEVAPACSGIRSLVALIALTTIYGFLNFKAPWKRVVMMAVAVPFAVLGNVMRLCFTIAVAETFGQAAGKKVETDAGFITFAVAVGCVFLVSRWLEKKGSTKDENGDSNDRPLDGQPFTEKPVTP